MKLKLKTKVQPPCAEKIKLNGEISQQVDFYIEYYQSVYGQKITRGELLAEMIAAFIPADRDFVKWRREKNAVADKETHE